MKVKCKSKFNLRVWHMTCNVQIQHLTKIKKFQKSSKPKTPRN